jgi:hypothetical protein
MSLHTLESGDLHAACVQIGYTNEWSQCKQRAASISVCTNVSANLNLRHDHQTVWQDLEIILA